MSSYFQAMFDKAKSLQSQGRKYEALDTYSQCSGHATTSVEAARALLEASRLLEGSDAVVKALHAYMTDPSNVEPLIDIARRACDAGDHKFAMWILTVASADKYKSCSDIMADVIDNSDDIENHPYFWSLLHIVMISAYHTMDTMEKAEKNIDLGVIASDYMHFRRGSPESSVALDNAVFILSLCLGNVESFHLRRLLGTLQRHLALREYSEAVVG